MSNSTERKYEKYVNKRDKVYQEILSIPILEEVFKLKKKEIKNIIKKNNKFIDDEKINCDFERQSAAPVTGCGHYHHRLFDTFVTYQPARQKLEDTQWLFEKCGHQLCRSGW